MFFIEGSVVVKSVVSATTLTFGCLEIALMNRFAGNVRSMIVHLEPRFQSSRNKVFALFVHISATVPMKTLPFAPVASLLRYGLRVSTPFLIVRAESHRRTNASPR
jgi:hypothetical protein